RGSPRLLAVWRRRAPVLVGGEERDGYSAAGSPAGPRIGAARARGQLCGAEGPKSGDLTVLLRPGARRVESPNAAPAGGQGPSVGSSPKQASHRTPSRQSVPGTDSGRPKSGRGDGCPRTPASYRVPQLLWPAAFWSLRKKCGAGQTHFAGRALRYFAL